MMNELRSNLALDSRKNLAAIADILKPYTAIVRGTPSLLNVCSEPEICHRVVGALDKGTVLTVVENNGRGWLRISTPIAGWIPEDLARAAIAMTVEEMQVKSGVSDIEVWEILNAPEFKTLTALNLRCGIGTQCSIITTIPANTIVKNQVDPRSSRPAVLNVGADSNGLWVMVEYQNQCGFVRAATKDLLPWWHNYLHRLQPEQTE